jgi:O-antigen/teichoic acid export membrane protein
MAEQTLKEKTAKGLFWGGLSNGIQQLLGMVFGIFLARILSVEDYGLVGMLTIFIAIANSISESGFTAALTNKPEFRHEDYNAVFWFNVIAAGGLYLILYLVAPLIASFFGRPELVSLSRVLFLTIVFGALGTAHSAVLFRKLLVKERAKIDLTALTTSGFIGVILALKGCGYWALAIQSLTYAGLCMFLRWFYTPWKPSLYFDFSPIKEMYGFSVKILFTNMFGHINANLFSVLLGKFYNATDVGFYTQGNKWMSMGYSAIGGMINGVAQPVFAEVNGDKERQVQVFRKMIRFAAFVSFPVMLGLAFVGEEFIYITVGEKWSPCVPILQLFCIWGAFWPIQLLYSQIVVTHGKSGFYLKSHIFIGLIQLLVAFLMLRLGVLWMVLANVLVNIIVWLPIWHWYVNQLIGVRLINVLRDIFPYISISLLIFLFVYLVTMRIDNMYHLIISKISLSIISYCFLMFIGKSVIFKESLSYFFKKK